MATIKAQFSFAVKDLVLTRSVYGAKIEFLRDGHQVQIRFPKEEDGGSISSWSGSRSDPDVVVSNSLQIAVIGDAAIGVRDFTGPQQEEAFNKAIAFADAALNLAQAVASELLERIRIMGQPWLCLHGQVPEWSDDWLVDVDTGERLPTGATRCLGLVTARDRRSALDSSHLQSLPPLLDDQRPPLPIAETLLADALYFLDTHPPDTPRAVLSAAIACELKVRTVLRENSPHQKRACVDLLLEFPRDWSLAAATLFDKVTHAVFEHSLRTDDPTLYKRVVRLFELRNRIVHKRGEVVDTIDANEVVPAARAAFQWLNRVARADIKDAPA